MPQGDIVRRYVEGVRRRAGLPADARVDVFAFGDSPEMNDRLGGLVFDGPKRATASLLAAYEAKGEPLPEENSYSVVLDGRGRPMGAIFTTEVRIRLFNDLDASFAFDEGEGDRSLDDWRDAHRDFFERECATLGVPFDEAAAHVVCERFKVFERDDRAGARQR
jgi:uncharacterized protein YhfF